MLKRGKQENKQNTRAVLK